MSNVVANGIKFNGQNYDDWIEYVKLNVGLLGLDSALVMDEPAKLDTIGSHITDRCKHLHLTY